MFSFSESLELSVSETRGRLELSGSIVRLSPRICLPPNERHTVGSILEDFQYLNVLEID